MDWACSKEDCRGPTPALHSWNWVLQ
uniref:Uncharacterized protein n=1 Tax=Anguilla anguilla TaxID=7936 RepID=A0A0E9PXU4_ANGAN